MAESILIWCTGTIFEQDNSNNQTSLQVINALSLKRATRSSTLAGQVAWLVDNVTSYHFDKVYLEGNGQLAVGTSNVSYYINSCVFSFIRIGFGEYLGTCW